MIDASVARRYARALLALGLEEGRHEKFGDELEGVGKALVENRDVSAVMSNPSFSQKNRQAAIDALAGGLQLSPVVVSFLRLLVDRQRIQDLPAILRAYRALVDDQVGRVRATVTSAVALGPEELARLRESLTQLTGRSVVLEAKIDPSIVGGLVTQVGRTLYDGSIKTQLERMREELKQGPLVA